MKFSYVLLSCELLFSYSIYCCMWVIKVLNYCCWIVCFFIKFLVLLHEFWALLLGGRVQFTSATQSCLTLGNPMDCSTCFTVQHQCPVLNQTHIHWVSNAIKPSHPLSSPSLPTFNLSQHQDLFKWVSFLHQVAKVLEHQFLQWIFGTDFL